MRLPELSVLARAVRDGDVAAMGGKDHNAVPEPGVFVLMSLGLGALVWTQKAASPHPAD